GWVGVIGAVFDAGPSFLHNGWWYPVVVRWNDKCLGTVPRGGFDQHVLPAAGRPYGELEALVVLTEDQDIVFRAGAQPVPPHLVRAVHGVGDGVVERPRASRPGQLVVGPVDAFRQVGAGGQVAHAKLVDLVAVEIGRVREQPPVRADLADPEGDVPGGAGRVVQQEILVEEDLGGRPGGGPAELLGLAAGGGPGVVRVPAPAPAGRRHR